MMISLSRKFLFLAGLKTASTSIEMALRPHCEISVVESRFGKHASLSSVLHRFDWVFKEIDISEFFVFGVMRRPQSFILSLYNSHNDERFSENPLLCTAGLSFRDFLADWIPTNYDQAVPQFRRFIDGQGRLVPNLLVDFDRLDEGMALAAEHTGLSELLDLRHENVSVPTLWPDQILDEERAWIEKHYTIDEFILQHRANKIFESNTQYYVDR